MNKTALDQYEEIVTDALKSCSAKLRKSFKTAFIQLMTLYMVLPRKINFTQMGRYSDSSEQRFRQLFEREFDWMQFNLFLMRQQFGESARKAIAFDASYISKSGKKTPYIGKFWSLRAEQTPDKAYLEKQGEEYNLVDWYLDVFRKYKDKLLDITRYIVADAWFSKAKFVNEACLLGFHVISRLRDDAALWYSHDGVRTGKRGRPRIKGEKIDFKKLVLQRCELLDMEGGRAYSVKAYSKAMKRNIKVVVHYAESGGHKIYFSTDLEMSAQDIIEYYRTRFQIEFCFRDSKQFTGLKDCQARDLKKLDFAFNASLASVNIAKVMRQLYYPSRSIGLLKAYLSNTYMLKRIFSKSGMKPNSTFNAKLIKELFGIVAEAA